MTSLDAYSGAAARRRLRHLYLPDRERSILQIKLRKASQPSASRKFVPCFEQLDSLALGSDSGALPEQPNQLSLDRARAILHELESEKLEPIKITPAAEGGVAICFANQERYSDIECLNSGEILGVISNRRDHPTVWEIEPSADGFARAIARIRAFLASTTTPDATGASR